MQIMTMMMMMMTIIISHHQCYLNRTYHYFLFYTFKKMTAVSRNFCFQQATVWMLFVNLSIIGPELISLLVADIYADLCALHKITLP